MKIGQFTVSYGNDEQHILFFEKMGTENVFCLFCWKLISCTIHRVLVSANTLMRWCCFHTVPQRAFFFFFSCFAKAEIFNEMQNM